MKAQKKEKKAEKKASGSSPKKSPKKKSGASGNAMSGKGFKSAEYIKDSGSSSDDEKGGNKSGSGSGSGGGKRIPCEDALLSPLSHLLSSPNLGKHGFRRPKDMNESVSAHGNLHLRRTWFSSQYFS